MHRILVVDDDKMNLILAKKFLQKEYEVVTQTSGNEALDYLKENTPDLILLDIQMPDLNGFDLIKIIHKDKQIPVIFLTADRSETTEEQCFQMGAIDYISKPFVPSIMLQRIKRSLELEDYRKNLESIVEAQLKRITQFEQNTIIMLGNIIESRDGTTGEHVKRTSLYVDFLIRKMKEKGVYSDSLTPVFSDLVKRAAPMHDIGKITIDDSILKKRSSLSTGEFEIMKLHTTAGGNIIRQNMTGLVDKEFIDIAYDVATYHHERWDGTGYPNKLKGEEIPLSARIMAVADVFDALSSTRSYKGEIGFNEAIEMMKKDSGVIFDPLLLETFIADQDELALLKDRITSI